VLTKDTKCPNQVFFVSLVDLQNICAKYGLETWFYPNALIRKCLLDMKYGSNKNAFWNVNKEKWRIWCKFVSPSLFNKTYRWPMLTKDTKCPNKLYFVRLVDLHTLFVLNRGWKRDSLQMMIFAYVCSTWSIVELKPSFETRITRNDVNGVSLFNLPYLIKLMAWQCSQRTPNVHIKCFMFDWSMYRLFVLNRAGNVIISKW
jgi:hypothetical protein